MRFLLLILLFPLACLAEPATVIRATELKKQPATDAAKVATLSENTAVDAGERQGGWTRVKAEEGAGWVKMLSLRYGAPGAAKQGDTGISQLFNVARTGSSGTQVTTGVRGLDADMIKAAQPNPGFEIVGFHGSRQKCVSVSSLPADRLSSMHSSWTSRTGWYSGRMCTIDAMRSRVVAWASAARKTLGDGARSSGDR